MGIHVRIDRIVVDDATLARRFDREVRAALETELADLIASTPRSRWRTSRTVRAVRGTLPGSAHCDIARAAAHALHRAVITAAAPTRYGEH
ncbi:hypothetical protein EU78_06245 [Mycolicibacterium rufum]|nr:hypothetical protein EU78_06245 [Mycolicibacterium rufum]